MTIARPVYVYTGSEWVPIGPQTSYITTRWTKTASGGETTLSGTDNNGVSLSYDIGYEQVYLNGVLLVRNVDYTASTGTTITGLTALTASDVIEVMTFRATEIADTYTQSVADGLFLTQSSASSTYVTQTSASTHINGDGTITTVVKLTQAAYDALTPDATTMYVIVG